MPLQIPNLDDRRYQDLLDEALARIPVHTPEWTNFNDSDPGVTLVQLFAFMTENLLYRSNQIPERNRLKFLSLLGVPLQPASSAQGLVTLSNTRGLPETITLSAGLEVYAGQVPFRTELGLDVLPVEARVYYKRRVQSPSQSYLDYYNQLYASYLQAPSSSLFLYQTLPLPPPGTSAAVQGGVDLAADTIDGSLWIALLVRAYDAQAARTAEDLQRVFARTRDVIGGKTINLGVVPASPDPQRTLTPGGPATAEGTPVLQFQIPAMPAQGSWNLPDDPALRVPQYTQLDAQFNSDILSVPGVVQITLPGSDELQLWDNMDPLESGVGDFPPTLDDTALSSRVLTWVRLRLPAAQIGALLASGVRASLLWVDINTVAVTQRAHVASELLAAGTGEPDQVVALTNTPVIPQSVQLTVVQNGVAEQWQEIDDLLAAGPEVPVQASRLPPGTPPMTPLPSKVFSVDGESGFIRFGDGTRGARPPLGATLRANYDYGVGRDGNVGPGAISSGPALPPGVQVSNPVRTWGGDAGESEPEGEKQIARYLQNRDRMVSVDDFASITLRTPGVDIGRVEVIPAFNPDLAPNQPGDAPGAVTVMVIPLHDPLHPASPAPDQLFLDTICSYIDSRRLITTEVFLRGPDYRSIWISVGINVAAGTSVADVRDAVQSELKAFLSPLPASGPDGAGFDPWPLRKAVTRLELWAMASRALGISQINDVLLAVDSDPATDQVGMSGLQLPRVAGISVVPGAPISLDALRSQVLDVAGGGVQVVPVPLVPEECT